MVGHTCVVVLFFKYLYMCFTEVCFLPDISYTAYLCKIFYTKNARDISKYLILINVSEGTWSKCIINANEIPITGLFFIQLQSIIFQGGKFCLFLCLYVVVCGGAGGACAAAVTTCGLDHLECPQKSGSLK
jgi:hypothetical protein